MGRFGVMEGDKTEGYIQSILVHAPSMPGV